MSYGIMPYLVPTDQITQLVGSRNATDLDRILSANKSEVDSLDDLFYDLWDDEAPHVKDILNDFIMGTVPSQGLGAAYGYTFKMLCEYFGRFLSNSEWYPCSYEQMELFSGIASYSLPVKFPSPDDFPMIRWVDGKQAATHLVTLEGKTNTGRDYEQFKSWLMSALPVGQDLYLFYH